MKIRISIILASIMLFSGCSNHKVQKVISQETIRCTQDNVLAPEFTCNPHRDGYIVALGIAKMNAGKDKSFQMSEAMANARNEISRKINIKVSNLLTTYKGSTAANTFDKSISTISKQISSQTLKNSKQLGSSWRNPKTGELFIMMGIKNEDVDRNFQKMTKTSFKNDEALYQRFLSNQESEKLKKETSQN